MHEAYVTCDIKRQPSQENHIIAFFFKMDHCINHGLTALRRSQKNLRKILLLIGFPSKDGQEKDEIDLVTPQVYV